MYKVINVMASVCLLVIGLSACGDNDNNQTVSITPPTSEPTSDCFWQGPYVIDNPRTNFAFP